MHYSIQDFIQLIAQLRNPNSGCPWDLKQNYDSMIPCLTEETYEVIDAIQKKDIVNLREELGDLLLQVVFLASLLLKMVISHLMMFLMIFLKDCTSSSSCVWRCHSWK